jgi:hypothetical protein
LVLAQGLALIEGAANQIQQGVIDWAHPGAPKRCRSCPNQAVRSGSADASRARRNPSPPAGGARVHDHLKGGDLDLYLEVEPGRATFANEMAFRDLIERPLDDPKVDVVLHERGDPLTPIDEIALRDGMVLTAELG